MRLGARWTVCAGWALLLVTATPAASAELRDGFAGALALSPNLRALEAQRSVITARQARAASLLPNAPVIGVGYRTSQFTRDLGLREVEGEIDAPLWLPGEARVLAATAEAEAAALAARIVQQRLLVAGEVRIAWWGWTAAVAERQAQTERVLLARALERDLIRQAEAGNRPEVDRLLATVALREAESALRAQDLAVRSAAIAFRTLTGLEPSSGPEEPLATAPGANEDPRLAASRMLVESGRAAERLALLRNRTNPVVGLQVRQERDAFSEPWGTRVQLRVVLPLQNPGVWREQVAAARATVAAGNAGLVTAGRDLTGSLDRARETRATALLLVEATEARHAALAQQARLYEAAFRAGQLPLVEVIRVRAQNAVADAARRRARAEAGRAISLVNQSFGVEP